ncbi:hypothetical protein [Mycobacteroides chelonae]|uniref:hypothetical protein n=1 Tax=Mycobacteroides chelonae TaxID=1774 RepID=UPI00099197ED|nr:hypothetical protein [Mycobacteroides chelonae]
MGAPTVSDLSAFMGKPVDTAQGDAVIGMVTEMARAYTRGRGFSPDPGDDVVAVILSASARVLMNPSQIVSNETMGPFAVSYRGGFDGWTTAELYVLNGYRVRAR